MAKKNWKPKSPKNKKYKNTGFYLFNALKVHHGQFFGKRYVFFKNLQSYSDMNGQTGGAIPQFVSSIEKYFNQPIMSQDPKKMLNDKIDQFDNVMESMINFLRRLVENEREAELKYARDLLNDAQSIKDLPEPLNNLLQSLIEMLQKIINKPEEFDYITYIKLINELKKDADQTKEDSKEMRDKIKKESEAIEELIKKNAEEDKKSDINLEEEITKYLYIFKRSRYNTLIQDIKENTISSSIKEFTDRINNLIKQLSAEGKAPDALRQNTQEQIANIIIFGALNGTTNIANLTTNIPNKIDYSNIFSTAVKNKLKNGINKSSTNLYKGLTNIIFNAKEIDAKAYKSTDMLQLARELTTTLGYYDKNTNKKQKQKITSLLRQIIQYWKDKKIMTGQLKGARKGGISKTIQAILDQTYHNNMQTFIDEFYKNNLEDFLKAQNYPELLKNLLIQWTKANAEIINITDNKVAEIAATKFLTDSNTIPNFLERKGYNPGTSISRKFDAAVTFIPLNADALITQLRSDEKQITQNFIDHAANFWEEFTDTIKKEIGNNVNLVNTIEETEVNGKKIQKTKRGTINIFNDMLSELGDEYSNLKDTYLKNQDNENLEKLQHLIERIQHNEISVKEYAYYYSKGGFEGGSLGSSKVQGTFITGLNNILTLYRENGLDIDNFGLKYDLIVDAGLNCGNDLFLNNDSDIIRDIKEFLITGAAMMMFETGFANTQYFIEKRKAAFQGDMLGANIVHFYHVQNTYVPASFVLQNIYENLIELSTDIRMTSDAISSNLYIDDPLIYNSDVKKSKNFENIKGMKRWETVSKMAQAQTEMKFMFLAGIEDMFTALANTFNNPTS